MNKEYVIGQQFGRLVIIDEIPNQERYRRVIAKCLCGTIKDFRLTHLKAGKISSCGCRVRKHKVVLGQKYNRLTIIEDLGVVDGKKRVNARCECGRVKSFAFLDIVLAQTISCGCARGQGHKTHGLSKHPLFKLLADMKTRCTNPNAKAYLYYGGRGIKVCDEWHSNFLNFYNWATENGWEKGLEIDRIDVNGNYEPTNCRFVTRKQNSRNKRNTKYATHNGIKLSLIEWSERLNINYEELHKRVFVHGMSIKEAITKPYDTMNKIFVHIPKTGGTSIFESLRTECGMNIYLDYEKFSGSPWVTFGHISLKHLIREGVVSKEFYKNSHVFTSVRNPYSRFVSLWLDFKRSHRLAPDTTLTQFAFACSTMDRKVGLFNVIGYSQAACQSEWLLPNIDILRFENLQEDFKIRFNINLLHLNSSGDTDWLKYYDSESEKIVREMYADDFAVLGYDYIR